MEFLLSREKNGTPELPAAQYPPVPINPALAPAKIAGDLLRGHYLRLGIGVNGGVFQGCFPYCVA